MYELVLDERALDFLCSLQPDVRSRIWKRLVKSKEDPNRYFERLSGRKDFKLRIGDYRVIADIDDSEIRVTLIGHRKNVYR